MYSTQVIVLHTTGQTKKKTSSVFCFAFVCHDTRLNAHHFVERKGKKGVKQETRRKEGTLNSKQTNSIEAWRCIRYLKMTRYAVLKKNATYPNTVHSLSTHPLLLSSIPARYQ